MSWLVIFGTMLVIYPIAIYMKKKLSISDLYTTVVFSLYVQLLVDTYAGFQYKAWGFFEVEKAEFKALWIVLGIYPVFSAMIINWFPYHKAWWKKFFYLMGWALFSTCYEWLTMKVGIMWHINWNIAYSFLLYPFIYYMLIVHVRFYQWIKRNNGKLVH